MRHVRAFFVRLAGLFNHRRRERELADELESHLHLHIEDNLRAGMTPVEARRQALIKLGGIEQTKEIYRDRWGVPTLESLIQDVRYGLRGGLHDLGQRRSFGPADHLQYLRALARGAWWAGLFTSGLGRLLAGFGFLLGGGLRFSAFGGVLARDWQAHSVRGFLSTAAKKHNLNIKSAKNESGDRVYKIAK